MRKVGFHGRMRALERNCGLELIFRVRSLNLQALRLEHSASRSTGAWDLTSICLVLNLKRLNSPGP